MNDRDLVDLGISPEFHPFVKNLSRQASSGDRMPFIGRQKELEAVMETLLRRLKNYLILVGSPGVGKTALITELADRINRGNVPVFLKGKVILELSIHTFFYSRDPGGEGAIRDLEKFFAEIRQNRDRIILFLDEMQIQSIYGADNQEPLGHFQRLLKTTIANRELTIIAAATPEDYFKYVKTDEILATSFSAILISEPEKKEMLRILRGVQKYFECYYKLQIPGSLFDDIYLLAERYIPHRAFPDKAIELLDISCSKASVKKSKKLSLDFIYQSVSSISRLPIEVVRRDPQLHYRGMLDYLRQKTVNQASALEEISRILKIAKLAVDANRLRPEGIFLFLGPPGIGKSYVAARIAEYLFGSPDKLRIIDLASFTRPGDAERLIRSEEAGSSGILIDEVEDHPFAVILFENIESAHAGVLDFLNKTLTKGEILDRFGKKYFLSNLIFILSLTSIGQERKDSAIGFVSEANAKPEIIVSPKIMNVLGWVDEIIQFNPLSTEHLLKIASETIDKLKTELKTKFHCTLKVERKVPELIASNAQKSGRFAYTVKEMVEREIKLKAMDLITKGNQTLTLNVTRKQNKIEVAAE